MHNFGENISSTKTTVEPTWVSTKGYAMFMAKKKLAVWVDETLEKDIDRLAGKYPGNKGDLVAAAIWMFMNAEKDAKAAAMREVLGGQIDRLFNVDAKPSVPPKSESAPPAPGGTPKVTGFGRRRSDVAAIIIALAFVALTSYMTPRERERAMEMEREVEARGLP